MKRLLIGMMSLMLFLSIGAAQIPILAEEPPDTISMETLLPADILCSPL
ncbi:MAG: hypothetical protein IKU26_00635 [Clostridia bacterium]|nr:hypothetical protein [Clostridia bacterium]